MVKIRVSYDNEKEFNKVIKLLMPVVDKFKKSKTERGKHKNAYIETNINIK